MSSISRFAPQSPNSPGLGVRPPYSGSPAWNDSSPLTRLDSSLPGSLIRRPHPLSYQTCRKPTAFQNRNRVARPTTILPGLTDGDTPGDSVRTILPILECTCISSSFFHAAADRRILQKIKAFLVLKSSKKRRNWPISWRELFLGCLGHNCATIDTQYRPNHVV